MQDGGGDVKLGLDPEEQFRLDKSPLFWCPLGGESMADVLIRIQVRLFCMADQGHHHQSFFSVLLAALTLCLSASPPALPGDALQLRGWDARGRCLPLSHHSRLPNAA